MEGIEMNKCAENKSNRFRGLDFIYHFVYKIVPISMVKMPIYKAETSSITIRSYDVTAISWQRMPIGMSYLDVHYGRTNGATFDEFSKLMRAIKCY